MTATKKTILAFAKRNFKEDVKGLDTYFTQQGVTHDTTPYETAKTVTAALKADTELIEYLEGCTADRLEEIQYNISLQTVFCKGLKRGMRTT